MLNFIAIYSRTGAGISHQNLKIFAVMEKIFISHEEKKENREQKILEIFLTFYGITGKKQVFSHKKLRKYCNALRLFCTSSNACIFTLLLKFVENHCGLLGSEFSGKFWESLAEIKFTSTFKGELERFMS